MQQYAENETVFGMIPTEERFGGFSGSQLGQRPPEKAYPGATDDRTSVKVHNPPGGKSSFSLGGGFSDGSALENITNSKRKAVVPPPSYSYPEAPYYQQPPP